MKPWHREVLLEVLKDYINSEVKKRAMALQRADESKRDPRESEAKYRSRIETLHQIYDALKGE